VRDSFALTTEGSAEDSSFKISLPGTEATAYDARKTETTQCKKTTSPKNYLSFFEKACFS
jgi:hypothetical protein